MVVVVVGDVKSATTLPIIEKCFGGLPAAPVRDPLRTKERPQQAMREVVIRDTSQPIYIEGYHRPDFRDPDDAVYDVLSDLLSKGRTSRLYRSLVRDKQVAVDAAGGSFPGNKYPNLFYFYARPSHDHTAREMAGPIHDEIEKLKSKDVSDEELQSIKTRAKADLIRGLNDNQGLAIQLGEYQAYYGDWRELVCPIPRSEDGRKAGIRRVTHKTFSEDNLTVGRLETPKATPAAQPEKGAEQ